MPEARLKSPVAPLHSEWWSFLGLLPGVAAPSIGGSLVPGVPAPLSPGSLEWRGCSCLFTSMEPFPQISKDICPTVPFFMSWCPGPEPPLRPKPKWVAPRKVLVLDAGSLEPGLHPTSHHSVMMTALLTRHSVTMLPPMVPTLRGFMPEPMNDAKQAKREQPTNKRGVFLCLVEQLKCPRVCQLQSIPHSNSKVGHCIQMS